MTLQSIWNAPASLTIAAGAYLVMTQAAFAAMPTLAGDDAFDAPGGEVRKALIGAEGAAAWHAIKRMDHCDRPFFTAAPIRVCTYHSED